MHMNICPFTGLALLGNKISKSGPIALFDGALGASAATWVGHYPWFVTHNFLEAWSVRNQFLDAHLKNQDPLRKNIRRALLGLMVWDISFVFTPLFAIANVLLLQKVIPRL